MLVALLGRLLATPGRRLGLTPGPDVQPNGLPSSPRGPYRDVQVCVDTLP